MWDLIRTEVILVASVVLANAAQTVWERYFGRRVSLNGRN